MSGVILGVYVATISHLASKTLHSDDVDYVNKNLALLYFCLGCFTSITGTNVGFIYDNFDKRTTLIFILII